MSDIDFSKLKVSAENMRKAENQNKIIETNFEKYLDKYRSEYYVIGNLENKGLSINFKNELEDIQKIKKIGVSWQLLTIDCLAIEDILRAYDCSKTLVATFALRYYLPSFVYNKSAIKLYNIIENTSAKDNISIPDIKITTIDDYNILFNKKLVEFNPQYQGKLEPFSLDFYKIDILAVQLFKSLYGFSNNSIIQNAIRCFLLEENYKNGELILRIKKRQDKMRKY